MERFLSWQVLATAALFIGPAVWKLLRAVKQRRGHLELDQAGSTATARVVAVEPMQRSVNGATGHPVTLALPDGRQVRDTSGLGGYIARTGTQVTVRFVPTDPDLVRVEAIVGPHGAYPVTPDGAKPPSLAAPVAGVLLAVAAPVGVAYLQDGDAGGMVLLPPLFAVVGLVMVVASVVVAVRSRWSRRRPTGDATGTVTEVWSDSAGNQHRNTVYPFTVYFATPDGREVHTTCAAATSSFHPRPPQPVRVRYDLAYPPRFDVYEVRHAKLLMLLMLAILGAIFLLVGSAWTALMLAT